LTTASPAVYHAANREVTAMAAGLPTQAVHITESASNDMVLNADSLDYDPGSVQCQHAIEVTNLGGRTWALQVRNPSGSLGTVASGMTTAVFCIGPNFTGVQGAAELPIRGRFSELKVVLSGAGAGAIAHIKSDFVGL